MIGCIEPWGIFFQFTGMLLVVPVIGGRLSAFRGAEVPKASHKSSPMSLVVFKCPSRYHEDKKKKKKKDVHCYPNTELN